MSLNQVTLLARLGKDPLLTYTATGTPVCKFSVATSEKWKDKSGEIGQDTQWHNIVVYSKSAENCSKYLSKGSQVLITGKITTRSWDDQDGVKRYMTEVIANNVQFIGGKENKEPQPERDF